MMGMDEPRTSLAGLQKDFPFESRLSLALLIRFWEDQAKDSSVRGEIARTLLTRLQDAPELTRPIDDITLLDQHSGLVDALMSAVFPSVFWEQAYMGALIPFTLRSVYGTRAMDTIMGPDGVLYGSLNLDMRALKDFRLINAYALALERLYGIHFPVDYPLILTLPDPTNGLDRHFKVQFEGRFVDVELLHPLPPLSEELRARLTAQAVDLDRLVRADPPGQHPLLRLHGGEGGRRDRPGGALVDQAGPDRQGVHRLERAVREAAGQAPDPVPTPGSPPGPGRHRGRPHPGAQLRTPARARPRLHLRGVGPGQGGRLQGLGLRAGHPGRRADLRRGRGRARDQDPRGRDDPPQGHAQRGGGARCTTSSS